MMSRFVTSWYLSVTSQTVEDYDHAASRLRSDADRRFALYGENWSVTEFPAEMRVEARIVQAVDDLDAAG